MDAPTGIKSAFKDSVCSANLIAQPTRGPAFAIAKGTTATNFLWEFLRGIGVFGNAEYLDFLN